MKHAVFYNDNECQEFHQGLVPEVAWHIERHETQREHCGLLLEGSFKSVEFMRQDEYEIFFNRLQGKDDGVGQVSWRGIL